MNTLDRRSAAMADPKQPAKRNTDPPKDPACASPDEEDTLDPSQAKPSMHQLAEEGAAEYRTRREARKKKDKDHKK
jgi:hypothetical protein